MPAGRNGDPELGADAIGGGNQDRILEAGRAQIEEGAEAAEARIAAGARRRL
jgi:hypothetical protein